MNTCTISFGMDIGKCIASLTLGWVPDWLWPLMPYWPIIAILVGAGVSYRLAGPIGLGVFGAVIGFIGGRRSAEDFHEHVGGKDATPPVRTPSQSKAKRKNVLFGRLGE